MPKLFEDSSMEKIAVVTDTGSNLSFEQAKELGIYLLPLQITIDETTYQDTLEISTQDIYKELAKGKMPKTSMAAYQKIYDLFEELKKEYDEQHTTQTPTQAPAYDDNTYSDYDHNQDYNYNDYDYNDYGYDYNDYNYDYGYNEW